MRSVLRHSDSGAHVFSIYFLRCNVPVIIAVEKRMYDDPLLSFECQFYDESINCNNLVCIICGSKTTLRLELDICKIIGVTMPYVAMLFMLMASNFMGGRAINLW